LPWGINLNAKQWRDEKLLSIALKIEEIIGGDNE
jgi:Asp-tRNA(Asn)/Glu-tRNA(Gln) amidotransferase A subunit family amidase